MKRCLIAVGVLAVVAASASAQQDSSRLTDRRAIRGAPGGPGWLGMGVQCSRCSVECSKGSGCRWTFAQLPGVFSVDASGPADKAGLRTGDSLVSIDGYVLTSPEGGERFGGIQPGQTVTLSYRRDGREAQAQIQVGTRPIEAARAALADSVRSLARLRTLQAERAQQEQRWLEQSRLVFEQQQKATQRVLQQMQRAREQLRDSVRSEDVRRLRQVLDSAIRQYRSAESLYARTPRPMPVPSLAPLAATPSAPAIAAVPSTPTVPSAPLAATVPAAPLAPMSYAEHREFGPLRYSGRLGAAVIEARSPYAVTTTEISDSEVVVTSRDLSVRIAVRPRLAPLARPAPAPKPAPTPQPARPARPPED